MTFTMKTEPWQWTLDPKVKEEKSDLLRPQTENYRTMKAQIEKAVHKQSLFTPLKRTSILAQNHNN